MKGRKHCKSNGNCLEGVTAHGSLRRDANQVAVVRLRPRRPRQQVLFLARSVFSHDADPEAAVCVQALSASAISARRGVDRTPPPELRV
jgi:hypothetical protein